jgi:hypothetical protein
MTDSLFLGALGALATVIGVLWKVNQSAAAKGEKRADRIETKNDKNDIALREQAAEIGELRGEVGLAKKVIPKIESLHEDFLLRFPKDKE